MADDIKLNRLCGNVENATLLSVAIVQGQQVNKGDVVAEIETDKATMELQADFGGFVKAIIPQIGQNLDSDDVLMIIGNEDETVDETRVQKLIDKLNTPKQDQQMVAAASGTGVNVNDLPAKTADLSKISLGDSVPLSRIQKITGDKMLQSKLNVPCFYLNTVVDMTDAVQFRSKMNRDGNVKISFNDIIIKAIAMAVQRYPVMGGRIEGENIVTDSDVNISLAVSSGDDLFAPVVKSVNEKTVFDISNDISTLVEKVKSGKLEKDDLEGGCCCLSNLGSFGVESFIPIVIPGQCFILGAGKIADSVVVGGKGQTAKKMMSITISVDHKVANGAYAAQFLDFVKKLLENPESLV